MGTVTFGRSDSSSTGARFNVVALAILLVCAGLGALAVDRHRELRFLSPC